mmetsp:Transcript_27440/g.77044  ORF Transcript_27440/g.77044 Transcript_27440/m.77044 type:complete len:86 (+) Transcript_27440:109-366(+)
MITLAATCKRRQARRSAALPEEALDKPTRSQYKYACESMYIDCHRWRPLRPLNHASPLAAMGHARHVSAPAEESFVAQGVERSAF